MILKDDAALARQWQGAAFRAAAQAVVAYYHQHWPNAQPTQLLSDITGEPGRLHFVEAFESLADYERAGQEFSANPDGMALVQTRIGLATPGTVRRTLQRVL